MALRGAMRLACALAWAGLAAAGCGEDLRPLPPISWEGEHLRFGTDVEGEPICGGTLPYMDRTVGAARERLGVLGEPPVDFYFLRGDLQTYEPPCPASLSGCGLPGLVRASFLPGEHEIVHAAKPFMLPQFFEEGLATFLGSRLGAPKSTDVLDAIRGGGETLSWDEYRRAGHFVSYLWQEYGPEGLLALADEGLAYSASRPDVEAAFAAAYGEPLADVVARYQADYPVCSSLTYRPPLAACAAADPLVLDGDTKLEVEVDLGCAGPDAVRDDLSDRVMVELPLEVTQDWNSVMAKFTDPEEVGGVEVELLPCDGGCWTRPIPYEEIQVFAVPPTEVPAGRYALSIRAPTGTEATVRLLFF